MTWANKEFYVASRNVPWVNRSQWDVRTKHTPRVAVIEESLNIPRRFVSDGTIKMVLENIGKGRSVEASCGAAGVSKTSWYRWLSEDAALAARYGEALREQTSSRYSKA